MPLDEKYMHRCIQLAKLASGTVAPNPMVGSVLVYDNKVIGEGYHRVFGEAHAEVNCINSVKPEFSDLICKSTLYVSLEPCVHFGKTPPCTALIIEKQIKKVVIGCRDPYEKVNGSGVSKLRDAGIVVVEGVLEKDCLKVNKRFFTFHKKQRPYVILKWAQSADGFIGQPGREINISNDLSKMLAHKWRSEEAAVLIGTETAITDDPSLTTRNWPGVHPLRIVFDRDLRIPSTSLILTDEHPTIIINAVKHEEAGSKLFYCTGADDNFIAVAMNLLHQRNIISVLVEGGAKVLSSFIEQNIWDEARTITNTMLNLNDGIAAPVLKSHILRSGSENGTDRIEIFTNNID